MGENVQQNEVVDAVGDVAEKVGMFLRSLRDRGLRPTTVRRRKEGLESFMGFFRRHGGNVVHDMTVELFDAYAVELREAGLKPASVDSNLRSVKLFYEYLADRCIIFENPLGGVVLGRPKPPPVQVITPREVRALLEAPDTSTPAGVRDRAMLEMLYACGMRREELLGLAVGDEDLDAETIRVEGKGGKGRVLPLGTHAAAWLRVYIEEARPGLLGGTITVSKGLWISRFHHPFTGRSIGNIIHRYRKKAGLEVRVTPHTLRRSCATHMLNNGASPIVVAELLGHADLNSLSHYLRIPLATLKAMHQNTPPGT